MSRAEQRHVGRRRLRLETLETRRLLAGDVLRQNIVDPEDANGDGVPTAQDALAVINELNRGDNPDPADAPRTDVNGDGRVTALDGLLIINRLNAGRSTSGVSHTARISSLQKARDNGTLPNGITPEQADEILATLKHGGRPELGERFRGGKMIKLRDQHEEVAETPVVEPVRDEPQAQAPQLQPDSQSAQDETEPIVLDEPLDLLGSADEIVSDDSDVLNDLVERLNTEDGDALAEHVRGWLADNLREIREDDTVSEWLERERLDRWVTTLQNGEATPQDILDEILILRGTAGDLREQIAQMFARFDIEAIFEQLPDFGTVVEAVTFEYTETEHDTALAELISGSLFALGF